MSVSWPRSGKDRFLRLPNMERYENLYNGATKLLFDNFVKQTRACSHYEKLTKDAILGAWK
jgi:hypothetical protein